MASSAPPVLPISPPQFIQPKAATTTAAATSAQSQPPVATPAFRSFVNNLTSQVREGFSQRRPWYELVDRSAFSKPESLSDATQRVRKNYFYFRVNYLTCLTLVVGVSLITHPGSLIILLGLLVSWIFLYLFRPSDQPLVMFGRSFSERETLGILVVVSVFVIFLTSVGSVLISALLVGVAIVCAHGAFRIPEDLFLDEPESASTGFLSFLGGAASNAVASVPSAVSRV